MCIAVNTDFGQFHQFCFSSMFIYHLHKFSSHLKTYTPILVSQIFGRRFRYIISEIKNNRDFREPFELFHRDRYSGYASCQAVDTIRHFSFREYKSARFIGYDTLDL